MIFDLRTMALWVTLADAKCSLLRNGLSMYLMVYSAMHTHATRDPKYKYSEVRSRESLIQQN